MKKLVLILLLLFLPCSCHVHYNTAKEHPFFKRFIGTWELNRNKSTEISWNRERKISSLDDEGFNLIIEEKGTNLVTNNTTYDAKHILKRTPEGPYILTFNIYTSITLESKYSDNDRIKNNKILFVDNFNNSRSFTSYDLNDPNIMVEINYGLNSYSNTLLDTLIWHRIK